MKRNPGLTGRKPRMRHGSRRYRDRLYPAAFAYANVKLEVAADQKDVRHVIGMSWIGDKALVMGFSDQSWGSRIYR